MFFSSVTNVFSLIRRIPFCSSHPSSMKKISFASSSASFFSYACWHASSSISCRPAKNKTLTAAECSALAPQQLFFYFFFLDGCIFHDSSGIWVVKCKQPSIGKEEFSAGCGRLGAAAVQGLPGGVPEQLAAADFLTFSPFETSEAKGNVNFFC